IIKVWNADSGEIVHELSGDGRRVNALEFNSDGSQLAVAGEGPNITIWNMKNGKRAVTLPERTGKTFSLAFCGNDVLASGESDNAIRFWDLTTGVYYADTGGQAGHTGTIATLVYDPVKDILLSGSFDTTVRVWAVPR
ncbi:MAG: WD40 repeat domain-containing protein, partial [Thermoguttaceae bacterium]